MLIEAASVGNKNNLFVIWLIFWLGKMASQTQGIQQLLAAEKRAAEKVAEARKRK
jgi:hypothetical protein